MLSCFLQALLGEKYLYYAIYNVIGYMESGTIRKTVLYDFFKFMDGYFAFSLIPLVVKTTNLISQTCMNTGFKRPYLLIYKGKVFIGSFGCRNDCLAVHFNCRKRRNAGVPPWNRSTGWVFYPCIVLLFSLAAAIIRLLVNKQIVQKNFIGHNVAVFVFLNPERSDHG